MLVQLAIIFLMTCFLLWGRLTPRWDLLLYILIVLMPLTRALYSALPVIAILGIILGGINLAKRTSDFLAIGLILSSLSLGTIYFRWSSAITEAKKYTQGLKNEKKEKEKKEGDSPQIGTAPTIYEKSDKRE